MERLSELEYEYLVQIYYLVFVSFMVVGFSFSVAISITIFIAKP